MQHAARTPPFGIAAALGLLAGATAMLWLPVLPPWPLLATAMLAGGWGWWRGGALRWIWAAVLGAGLAGLHAAYSLSVQLPPDAGRQDVTVSGRVIELPVHEPRRSVMTFRVDDDAAQPEALRGRRLRIAWYGEGYGDAAGSPHVRVRAGEHWTLDLRVRPPRGLRNPGGFDGERNAMVKRLAATGYVRNPSEAVRLAPATGLHAWRESMSDAIAKAVPSPSSRFVQALALGDTRGLSDADWQRLRANGLTHLVAISGFHVGLVAGLAALLAALAWRCLPGLARWCPRPVAAAGAGLAGALVYAAVAGFALPTVRTVLMIAVVAALKWQRRPVRMAEALALAAIVLVLFDPLALLTAGLWLSFAGVAWLLWCLPERERRPVRELLSAQGVASLGLLPLTVALFGEASLAGPLANLVAVPWWSLVVVPMALLGTLLEVVHAGAGEWAWRVAAGLFDASWPLFGWLADTGLALWWLPEPRWFALPLALAGAFWLLLPRGLPGRPLAIVLWLPLLLPARQLPHAGGFELTMLDVGHGLAVVVRTADHALLYDGGPAVPEGFDAGERVVVPALRALGVRRLDRLVVSHADNDHAGGVAAVLEAFDAPVVAPDGSGLLEDEGATPCEAGQAWTWDGVTFEFLHPPPHFPYLGNEASCVLSVRGPHGHALLTGDIGEVVERTLVKLHPGQVAADVVTVAHHGSAGSSDPVFVAATRARHALVASGHGNRFGHPKPEVSARWRDAGADLHDTAEDGAISVRFDPGGIQVRTRRDAQPRLWDAQARSGTRRGLDTGGSGLSYGPE